MARTILFLSHKGRDGSGDCLEGRYWQGTHEQSGPLLLAPPHLQTKLGHEPAGVCPLCKEMLHTAVMLLVDPSMSRAVMHHRHRDPDSEAGQPCEQLLAATNLEQQRNRSSALEHQARTWCERCSLWLGRLFLIHHKRRTPAIPGES
jgi:hypothetical protein